MYVFLICHLVSKAIITNSPNKKQYMNNDLLRLRKIEIIPYLDMLNISYKVSINNCAVNTQIIRILSKT